MKCNHISNVLAQNREISKKRKQISISRKKRMQFEKLFGQKVLPSSKFVFLFRILQFAQTIPIFYQKNTSSSFLNDKLHFLMQAILSFQNSEKFRSLESNYQNQLQGHCEWHSSLFRYHWSLPLHSFDLSSSLSLGCWEFAVFKREWALLHLCSSPSSRHIPLAQDVKDHKQHLK